MSLLIESLVVFGVGGLVGYTLFSGLMYFLPKPSRPVVAASVR